MKILAIETSGKVASTALLEDYKVISEIVLNTKLVHSVMLIDLIDQVLRNASSKIEDVDLFAASIGPGSFTGLRIGVSTIKGFCYATSKPCIGVDTLMALCYNFWACSDFLMPILDAKSQKVFTGIFRFEKGKLKTYHPTSILDIEEAKELAKKYDPVLLGEGLDIYDFSEFRISPKFLQYQKASNVGILALTLAQEGKICSHFDLIPVYLKKSYAERDHDT
ncbi:tRNA threonylcarbamoyl adenosine modification protein YeaZ [Caldicellulosiruptor bescii]|uniref:Peptidase M22 glycoprotease n=2 Tax=Caldicellulosiruptor bescii TaxID=31899 RepID=B9MNP8_CALBD|nr:tRNA (adenosine(37)-N6)-threonylcarbamoyltransferase complex dimerization subunit type 1 TsaB [Caldicellulosiruptor bescii]ACM59577.1 peptidase M22 glycoprotease [Caldicellulosiruptor bescii DSM 6725]PBC89604.1 tRNA threonylcarbamoyl adenosine modification protein YeaZ [Caldicellulosiruptor bescii]PBC89927.1 tRNA threonylcarbamoyl adenosine modification protein YeaZ [Caldicellulosiruptor bescii]PBD04644.1 tRNA threonylcarbamoyl adenosine modification protein YeaZ [Caldicellulosiruptor bescii